MSVFGDQMRSRMLMALVGGIATVVVACGKAPPNVTPVVKTTMTLTTTADVNPNEKGIAQPVVVRVYQLTSETAFKSAEFFALYDDDRKTLGPELLKVDEYVLKPSDKRIVDLAVDANAQFLAAAAAFRDIRNAQWRRVVPAPMRKDVTVQVGRDDVTLTIAN
jgi:type VI secretion system protein VasD